jgi:hypothetical protein
MLKKWSWLNLWQCPSVCQEELRSSTRRRNLRTVGGQTENRNGQLLRRLATTEKQCCLSQFVLHLQVECVSCHPDMMHPQVRDEGLLKVY